MPNIHDVAKFAKVSISTVSRVLNRNDQVSSEIRERVMKAIHTLNYQPNGLARGLIHGRTQTIGVLIPDISNFFFAEVVRGIEETAYKKGWNVIICNTAREESSILNYINILGEKRVDGILFTSRPVTAKFYEALEKITVPVVLVATKSSYRIPAVKIKDEKASFDAVNYLIQKGHRHIGMISGPLNDPIAGVPRLLGFFKALEAANIPYSKDQVFNGDFRFASGKLGAEKLLAKVPNLTAIFTASDEMALGVYSYAFEKGIHIPNQLSVIGFDNVKVSYMCNPPLTTVAQPLYQLGGQASSKLIDMITRGSSDAKVEYIDHQIMERNSVIDRQ